MADEEKSEETSAAEIRMIYQQHFDEFHFLKRQQWTVTYYTVLVYAALVAVKKLVVNAQALEPWLSITLTIVAISTGLASAWMIFDLQRSLSNLRKRWVYIRKEHLTPKARALFDLSNNSYTSVWYHFLIWGLMILVAIVGMLLVILIIWLKPAIVLTYR